MRWVCRRVGPCRTSRGTTLKGPQGGGRAEEAEEGSGFKEESQRGKGDQREEERGKMTRPVDWFLVSASASACCLCGSIPFQTRITCTTLRWLAHSLTLLTSHYSLTNVLLSPAFAVTTGCNFHTRTHASTQARKHARTNARKLRLSLILCPSFAYDSLSRARSLTCARSWRE
jgi:hypothetical protein